MPITISFSERQGRDAGSQEWEEMYSETGTEHLFLRTNYAASENRKQAACGFHLLRDSAEPVLGKVCSFCLKEAKLNPKARMIQGVN